MENIVSGNPTWDLLLGVCLFLIVLYGFIIGQAKTIKTLLALYPAYFISDFMGTLLPTLLPDYFSKFQIAIINGDSTKLIDLSPEIDFSGLYWIVGTKLFFFFLFWILITVKSPFFIDMPENRKKIGNAFLHFIYSIAFGILFVNIVLLLMSGYSIFAQDMPTHILSAYMKESFLITLFIKFYGSWFSFPAFVLILSGFLYAPVEDDDEDEPEEAREEIITTA